MTTPPTRDDLAARLRPQVVADVLERIADHLDPGPAADTANGAMVAAQPHPAAEHLVDTVHALERYAGPALAGPILDAANRAAADLEGATAEADGWRARALELEQVALERLRIIGDAATALELLGDAYAAEVVAARFHRARLERLEEYLELCIDSDRKPTRARTAAVLREADKATDRHLAELAEPTDG